LKRLGKPSQKALFEACSDSGQSRPLGNYRSWRKDGVIGRLSLWIAEDFWVLRFRLMVKRGPWLRPQASEGEAQHGPFCWTRRFSQEDVCIVDDTGSIVREVKVASEPEALLPVLTNPAYHFKRIGLEAGPLSQWLFSALAEAGLPAICVETRHMRAVLRAQINKTDRNDARGMAQMMRVGLYRPVHVKTLRSQKLRMLLTHRKLLQSKAIAIDNDLRGTLRNFGLKVGVVGTVKFEARIKELVEDLPDLAELVEPLLIVRRTLREQIGILHRRLLAVVRNDEVCRRLMTIPGIGPVVALTYRATVDVPARFRNSKAVGAVFGLTPSKYQSGEINRTGAISKCGDEMMRVMLYEAAQIMLVRLAKWSWLKAWAMKIARHRGMKKAIVALARRLAVIMHRIWVDGTEFQWTREATAA
jgi:transposase